MIRPVLASVLLTCVLLGIAYLLFTTTRSLPPASPMTPNPIVYVEIPVTDLERVRKAGGKVLYPEKRLDGLGSVAEFEDSEGNRIALFAAQP